MKAIDFTKIFEQYKGLWVTIIHENEVVSANKDITKAREEADKKGFPHARLFKVPQENLPFVGFHV